MADQPATLVKIKTYFETSIGGTGTNGKGIVREGKPFKNATDFGAQWKALSEKDQVQLRAGIGNGSLTY